MSEQKQIWQNKLFCGDNLDILFTFKKRGETEKSLKKYILIKV